MNKILLELGMTVTTLLSFSPALAYDFEIDGIAYTITSLTDFTVGVDQLVNKDVTAISIPEKVEYKNKSLQVTSIEAYAFEKNTTLCEVTLPNSIISIGGRAFINDSSLTKINTPESLTKIGSEAFSGCSSLTLFSIPKGVQEINDKVFYGCTSLTNIRFNADIQSIGESSFENSGLQTVEIPSSVKSLGESAFAGTPIEAINIPDGINIIPKRCFSGCSKLSNVTFFSSQIGVEAFKNCISLQHVSLPLNLTTIGDGAFQNCESLEEFIIPSTVTKIEPNILWGCNNIETLKIGSGLNGLPVYADHNFKTDESWYSTIGSYNYYSPSSGFWGKKTLI